MVGILIIVRERERVREVSERKIVKKGKTTLRKGNEMRGEGKWRKLLEGRRKWYEHKKTKKCRCKHRQFSIKYGSRKNWKLNR